MDTKDRVITLIYSDGSFYNKRFNSKETKDSEMLHQFLCEFDPGDIYTVKFSNIKDHVWNCTTIQPAPGLEFVRCNCLVDLNK